MNYKSPFLTHKTFASKQPIHIFFPRILHFHHILSAFFYFFPCHVHIPGKQAFSAIGPRNSRCLYGVWMTFVWGIRLRIDGGLGDLTPQFPCSFHCDPSNSLVPAVLLTFPVHFSHFEPWGEGDDIWALVWCLDDVL